ncbi:bifunctional metallophosphatase/5'-nucleotidase [Boudabousia marimammalium]|uniref:Bifunctional metallophosphatase/5'-nucleotidase n=1 Tax=Boudabousia marimammalium TaxID=156892 RepID=A0A1Q5PSM2_9ACTO|nr:bifunctional UDP-sugar hydrolase/5'-nucleotidase [Boudabousia marimammalium]OKL50445.1 bifunctional metallophosphatase/5'-nucleotidase [Boudabousia marimammalium]
MKRKLSTAALAFAAATAVAMVGLPGVAAAETPEAPATPKATVETPATAEAPATAETPEATGDVVTLDLYNLTDVHGHIEQVKHYKTKKITEAGLASVGCYLDEARAANPNSSFTLLGDNTGASPFTSGSLYDNPTIAALNELHPLASTLGNHELDLGQAVFKARVAGTKATVRGEEVQFVKLGFPYLAANVEGLGASLGDYKVWESPSGVKVAFIGAIAEDVPYKLSPGTTTGMTFNDPIAKINTLAKQLKDSGEAQVVIAMLDDDVKNNFPKMGMYVDGLMGGDTHVPYDFDMVNGAEGNKLSATASGSYTDNLSKMVVKFNKKTGKVVESAVELIPAPALAECDVAASATGTAVKAIVDKAVAESKVAGAKVVATGYTDSFKRAVYNQADGTSKGPGSNRGHESTLGTLAADAMRDQIMVRGAHRKPVDIGIINAGGLRADLVPNADGTLTYQQTYAVMPFSNELGYVTLSGAQFKKALEQQWKTNLNSQNSRPMLKLGLSSNVRYTYDPEKPYGERITSISINGEPIDMDAMYTVGSVTFLLDGGDSFDALTENGPALTDGILDRDGFNAYLAKAPVKASTVKHSVGVTAPESVKLSDGSFDIALRGLSFTEGAGIPDQVKVFVGDASEYVQVNNSLNEANPNSETESVITTDGAGQATVSFVVSQVCEGAHGTLDMPIYLESDMGELVSADQGLTISVDCGKMPTPEAKAKGNLAKTGSSAVAPIVMSAALLALLGGAAVALKRRETEIH